MVADFAHEVENIDIDYALKQMEEGDDGEFIVFEGVAEAVVEPPSDLARPCFSSAFVLE